LNVLKEPLHHTPSFYPETYDQIGYTKLLDTLIRWEMTRSMYDWKFGMAISQIKSLSRITNSDYGMAMFHYFEGIRRGLGDPLNAENDFLKALEYFEAQKDTSGILHTSMHLFRLGLNTAMLDYGVLTQQYDFYQKVLDLGSKSKNPLDKVIHLRNTILYDEYICGEKNVQYYKDEIEKGLSIIETLDSKYDYYKFLMLNTVGIIHSKSIKTVESEYYHSQAFDVIQKYTSRELFMAAYRLAAMKYANGKYEESLYFLKLCRKYNVHQLSNFICVQNLESVAYMYRLSSQNFDKIGDEINSENGLKNSYTYYNYELPKQKYLLYMKNMAALHENELNSKIIFENERRQFRQRLVIFASIFMIGILFVYTYIRFQNQKKLEKEIRHKNFIYSMIGHDLSSPLIDIDMILDDIIIELDEKLNANQKNYLNKIRTTSQGANLLLNNLLNLYKQESGFYKLNENRLFANIKDEINISIRHLFNDKYGNIIHLENNCNADVEALIDKPSFECVIRNIVDNAIKHSRCSKIIFDASIDEKYLVIRIVDNGIGLSDDIAEIFNKNGLVLQSSNVKTKIGLGTIFILEFVKALKSELKVKTSKNGTEYTWRIPIYKNIKVYQNPEKKAEKYIKLIALQ
jgi:signal transduction histidine kinase